MEIVKQLQDELKQRSEKILEQNPSYAQTEEELLELIDKYSNSHYFESDYDSNGDKKPFYNIHDNPSSSGSKEIDIDLADIHIRTEPGHSHYIAWLYEKEFKNWAEENKMSQILNQVVNRLPKIGHIVLKRVKGNIYGVRLKNIYSDPVIENIENSDYIIEKHEDTFKMLKDRARKSGWFQNNVEMIIEKAKAKKLDRVVYYERYGEVGGEADGAEDEYNFHIIADPELGLEDEDAIIYKGNQDPEYKELKWEEVDGRHLGRGTIEKLAEEQRSKNTLLYYLQKGLQWTSLHLWQTRDQNVAKNLLTQHQDGDILRAMQGIEQLPMEERNIPAYNFLDQLWERNIQNRTFSYESLSGQRPPAGTTLGSHSLALTQAGKFYDLKREDVAIFFREMIEEWIIPNFKKDKKGKHRSHLKDLLGDDEDSQKIFNAILADRMLKKQRKMFETGKYLTPEKLKVVKSIMAEKLMDEDLEVPDSMYENVKMKVDVVISAEKIDFASQNAIYTTLIQLIGSNPQVMKDPINRKILFNIMENSGMNPVQIFGEKAPTLEEASQEAVAQTRGGSLSRPPTPTNLPTTTRQPVGAGAMNR